MKSSSPSSSYCFFVYLIWASAVIIRPSAHETNSSSSNVKVPDDEQKKVCSNLSDPRFCFQFLKSTKELQQQDIRGLCETTINLSKDKLREASAEMKSLVSSTVDAKLKARYNQCLQYSTLASGSLDKTVQGFDSSKFNEVISQAESASFNIHGCVRMFTAPPAMEPSLQEKLTEFENVITFLRRTAELLGNNN